MLKILIFFVAVFLGFQAVSEDQSELEEAAKNGQRQRNGLASFLFELFGQSENEMSHQRELSAEECEQRGLPEKCKVWLVTREGVPLLERIQIDGSAEACERRGLPEKCKVWQVTSFYEEGLPPPYERVALGELPPEIFEGLDTLCMGVNMSEEEQRVWDNRLKKAAEGLPPYERVALGDLTPEIFEGLEDISEEEWRAWRNELQKETEDAKNGQRQRNWLESFLFE